jgi:transcriptional regulator with XRE-family HTH domain
MSSQLLRQIGRVVKRKREAAGLSQVALAREAGIHKNTILHLERGDVRSVNFSTIEALAAFFNLRVTDLIDNASDITASTVDAKPVEPLASDERCKDVSGTSSTCRLKQG